MLKRIKNYDMDQKLILITCIAMYLPFYIGFAFLAFDLFYFIYTNQIGKIAKEMSQSKFLFIFVFYSLTISVINQNSYGLMASITMLIFFMFFLFYRMKLNKDLFKDSIRIIIFMTGLTFALSIMKYLGIFIAGEMSFVAIAEYSAENREISAYFNSNYYAMVCEMMIIITGYMANISRDRKKKFLYILLTALGFGALILTGSRSALATAVILLIVMNLMMAKTKIVWIEIAFALFIGINIIGETGLFPRFGGLDDSFGLREKIWREAIALIKNNWLTGVGPLGLHSEVHSIGSRIVHHSHNIIFDGIINFGALGIALLLPFVMRIKDEIMNIKRTPHYLVIVMLTAVVLVHGMVDVTIFWHQTAFIYFVFIMAMGKLYPLAEKEAVPLLQRKTAFSFMKFEEEPSFIEEKEKIKG